MSASYYRDLNDQLLTLLIDWKSKSDQEAFAATDAYQQLRKKLVTRPTGIPDVVQVDFEPEGGITEALSAPITEVATFYFDKAPPGSAFGGAKTLLEALIKEGHNVLGWAYGTTLQEIEREGVRGKGNMLIVGWETVEAHAASHDGQAIKENIQLLTTPDVKTYQMHHVQATAYDSK